MSGLRGAGRERCWLVLALPLACTAARSPVPAAAAFPPDAPAADPSAAPGRTLEPGAAGAPATAPLLPAQPAATGLQVGDTFVDFGLPQLELASGRMGASIWLSDLVGPLVPDSKRRVVLLNFFAVWCHPCFEELRVLDEWQRRYGVRGLQVLSVNFRGAEEDTDEVLRETLRLVPPTLGFPLLFERYTKRNQSLYLGEAVVLPANLLLDRDGRVIERVQGATPETLEKLRRAIEERVFESPGDSALPAPGVP